MASAEPVATHKVIADDSPEVRGEHNSKDVPLSNNLATQQSTFSQSPHLTKYGDAHVANSVNAVMTYIEGTFGALVMFLSGALALVCSIKIDRRNKWTWLPVALFTLIAIGAFWARAILSPFCFIE